MSLCVLLISCADTIIPMGNHGYINKHKHIQYIKRCNYTKFKLACIQIGSVSFCSGFTAFLTLKSFVGWSKEMLVKL